MNPHSPSRGADWALPNKNVYSTAITRPIRVQIFGDRLVIVPERGERQRARTVPLPDAQVRPQIETFVSEVWSHTEGWGLAVLNGYWKPILRVEVAPGADAQFREFEQLMSGSGLEVERKK